MLILEEEGPKYKGLEGSDLLLVLDVNDEENGKLSKRDFAFKLDCNKSAVECVPSSPLKFLSEPDPGARGPSVCSSVLVLITCLLGKALGLSKVSRSAAAISANLSSGRGKLVLSLSFSKSLVLLPKLFCCESRADDEKDIFLSLFIIGFTLSCWNLDLKNCSFSSLWAFSNRLWKISSVLCFCESDLGSRLFIWLSDFLTSFWNELPGCCVKAWFWNRLANNWFCLNEVSVLDDGLDRFDSVLGIKTSLSGLSFSLASQSINFLFSVPLQYLLTGNDSLCGARSHNNGWEVFLGW